MGTVTDDEPGGVDWRQLALVSLCLVALVVASFLAPPQVPGAPGSGGDSGGSGGGSGAADGCVVRLSETPAAGDTLTVRVAQDLDPVESARVWFNDKYVGKTNASGRVTGTVPYQRELNVTVQSTETDGCQFEKAGPVGPVDSRAGPLGPDAAGISMPNALMALSEHALEVGDAGAPRQQTTVTNSSGTYDVSGDINVTSLGEPYPDATVTVAATIEGGPVRNGTVTVDGEQVGRTDSKGRYRLSVPDRDSADVTVTRGEFSGSTEIDVRNLDISVRGGELFPIPGDQGYISASIDGDPVDSATISVGGQPYGTTGTDGRVGYTLPATPGLTVTATTDRQTATTTVFGAYAGTIVVGALLFGLTVVTVAVAVLLYGRGVARAVGIGWAVLDSLFFVAVLWDRNGLLIGLAVVGVAALFHYRRTARSGGATVANAATAASGTTKHALSRVVDWTRRAALRLVTLIESLLIGLRTRAARLTAWVGSLPRSASALWHRLSEWLRRVGRQVQAGITPVRVTAFGLCGLVTTLAYVRWGAAGAVVSAFAFTVAAIRAVLRGQTAPPTQSTDGSATATGEPAAESSPEAGSTGPSLRDIWRTFARMVVPGRWRTRSPREVSRAAVESGLPREPVEALTRAFEEAEYGGRPSDSRREQARAAYEALVNSDAEETE